MAKKPVSAGDWFRRNGGRTVRRVLDVDGETAHYLQFDKAGPLPDPGVCTLDTLRAWGKPVAEGAALECVPNLDEQWAAYRDSRQPSVERLFREMVRHMSDDMLIAEITRRGYQVREPDV